jgi:hypothetical protein
MTAGRQAGETGKQMFLNSVATEVIFLKQERIVKIMEAGTIQELQ